MAIQVINIGSSPNDGKGEPLRDSLDKVNKNFTELASSIKAINDEKLGKNDNAASASKWKDARTINVSGGVGGSVSIDGSKDVQLTLTIKKSGVVAGTFGGPRKSAVITVNDEGRITVGTEQAIPTFSGSSTGFVPPAASTDANKVLSGSGKWVIPENTTYSGMTTIEINAATGVAERLISPVNLRYAIEKWAPKQTNITGNAATATKLQKPFKVHGIETDGSNDIEIPTFSGSSTGLVPAATVADASKVLSGAGKWVEQSGGGGSPDAETAKKLVKPNGSDLIAYRDTSTSAQDIEMYGTRLNFMVRTVSIAVEGSEMFNMGGNSLLFSKDVTPRYDNQRSLGGANNKWKDCYLQNAPIVTSDANSKMDIVDIDDAEKACAVDLRKSIKKYKLKAAVAEKGSDARYHFGVIAQEVITVFEQHGLDAFAYGIVCYSEWEAGSAEVDKEGNIVAEAREAGSAYAIRYEELNMFLLAAL